MSNNLIVQLREKTDSNGRKYFVGKLETPCFLDCRDGVTFLVFTSDVGVEELQIAPMTKHKKDDDMNEYPSKKRSI